MITELDAITDAEQILSSHWEAICASERIEVQIAQAQPQEHPDAVTVADVAIGLLALALLVVIGWNLS